MTRRPTRTAAAFAARARRREIARVILTGSVVIASSAAFIALCLAGTLAG